MCIVSSVGDTYTGDFPHRWGVSPSDPNWQTEIFNLRVDAEKLRTEVEELKKLLIAAKKFDKATGQPDCEMDKKVIFIKKLAELLDVDMEGVFLD